MTSNITYILCEDRVTDVIRRGISKHFVNSIKEALAFLLVHCLCSLL